MYERLRMAPPRALEEAAQLERDLQLAESTRRQTVHVANVDVAQNRQGSKPGASIKTTRAKHAVTWGEQATQPPTAPPAKLRKVDDQPDQVPRKHPKQGEFARALLQEGNITSLSHALSLWRDHGEYLDIREILRNVTASNVPSLGHLIRFTRAPLASARQYAWDLITEMLPALHAVDADLDGLWFTWQRDPPLSMPITLMISAVFAGQTAAVTFLTSHGYCFGVHDDHGKPTWDAAHGETSPLSQLIVSWLYHFPANFGYQLFSPKVNGNWSVVADTDAAGAVITGNVFTSIPGKSPAEGACDLLLPYLICSMTCVFFLQLPRGPN